MRHLLVINIGSVLIVRFRKRPMKRLRHHRQSGPPHHKRSPDGCDNPDLSPAEIMYPRSIRRLGSYIQAAEESMIRSMSFDSIRKNSMPPYVMHCALRFHMSAIALREIRTCGTLLDQAKGDIRASGFSREAGQESCGMVQGLQRPVLSPAFCAATPLLGVPFQLLKLRTRTMEMLSVEHVPAQDRTCQVGEGNLSVGYGHHVYRVMEQASINLFFLGHHRWIVRRDLERSLAARSPLKIRSHRSARR